jgi:protein-S-isoprenylcysteine O-methyltransferase Ste14
MKAADWEFTNRALIFGLIFGLAFPLYLVDRQNAAISLANLLGGWLPGSADRIGRLLFALAALLVVAAALLRTWASAYLHAGVVYAPDIKTESLVADGPYRRVRNPLYLANVLMAAGMGALMSRVGFFVAVAAMLCFCYRLIRREEAELEGRRGERYASYRAAVSRLWPSVSPRVPSAGRRPMWRQGLAAESWCWGFAAAVIAFAASLSLLFFFVILAISLVGLWVSSAVLQKRVNPQR